MNNEIDIIRNRMYEQAVGKKRFHTVDGETIMDKEVWPTHFAVNEILPYGLTLLVGPAKVGKSLLTLGLCIAISKGEPFLGFPTKQGTVLYLALEDTEDRIQKRALKITDDLPKSFHFSNEVYKTNDGLIEALDDFITTHPDTVLIAIDVFEYIRPDQRGGNMYRDDYDDMIPLHKFTQEHDVALLLVHHTSKRTDGDEIHSASGSMAITGAVDNYLRISRSSRIDRQGSLYCTGRDMADKTISLRLDDNGVWQLVPGQQEYVQPEFDKTVLAVWKYIFFHLECKEGISLSSDMKYLTCIPTALSNEIKRVFDIDIPNNTITKSLQLHRDQLAYFGLEFQKKHIRNERQLIFSCLIQEMRRMRYSKDELPEDVPETWQRDGVTAVTAVTAADTVSDGCHTDATVTESSAGSFNGDGGGSGDGSVSLCN